jgi:hypothetical protein
LPRLAALEQGIPVIAVRENRNRMRNELGKLPFGPGKLFIAENYPAFAPPPRGPRTNLQA